MENFYGSCLCNNNTTNQSVEKCTPTATLKTDRKGIRTICDISNVERNRSERRKKPSIVRKYQSVYLKKYVWSKGVKHYRRYKKAFVIPVIHVLRRPDNPFNVKTVVENLKKKETTSPMHKMTDNNEHPSVNEELCFSNLENKIIKTRNWEAIRYKYQLDYKERLKMERENYLKKCGNIKKMSQKHHNTEHKRQLHENPDEHIRKGPRNVVVSNEGIIADLNLANRHLGERQKITGTSIETSVLDGPNIYYKPIKYDDNPCTSIDLTEDYRNRSPEIRFIRNEPGNNIQSEAQPNKILVNSDTASKLPSSIDLAQQSEDFDFSIPFNESNILVKVMTPDRKTPSTTTNQYQQPHCNLLQNTLLHDSKPAKHESKSSKRHVSVVDESKTNNVRHDSAPRNEWLQYIQNLLNKTPKLVGQPVDKMPRYASTSKPYVDHRPIPSSATIQKPSTAHAYTTNTQIKKYPDPQPISRVKVDRPVVANPRLIKPKVMHPSPYYRPDFFRHDPPYESVEEPIVVNMPVRRHSPPPTIRDQSSIPPPHMEYAYANHPSYRHDYMVRSMQLPFDMTHGNLMGQPVYSPYDHGYMQYPVEMERMPPYTDRFIQHNNVPPSNRSFGFMPPRPAPPGVYRYLNPQHDHPLWIYPNVLER